MAITVSKVDVWAADIPDQPGALDHVLQALGNAGANIECLIGRRRHDLPGTGQVFVSPVKGKKVQLAARSVGLSPAVDMVTLRIESPNKPGVGHKIMAAIAAAGVNVRGVSVVGMGNKSVAYIGLDANSDVNAAIKVIKNAGK
jgi:hypothetical protein